MKDKLDECDSCFNCYPECQENKIKELEHKLKQYPNPFCDNCKEEDCLISEQDGMCEMVRVYLNVKSKNP